MEHSVLAVSCRALIAACEKLGASGDALLAQAGIEKRVIDDPDGRVTPAQVMGIWEAAYATIGDPCLSLHVAEHVPKGAYRVLEYVIGSAPTIGAGFEKISEYFPWIDTSVQLPIERSGDLWAFGVDAGVSAELTPRQAMEFTFATCLRKVREESGVSFSPVRIEMACSAPTDIEGYEGEIARLFCCPLVFESERNVMLFDDGTWQTPSNAADAPLLSILEEQAQQLLSSVHDTSSLSVDVKRILTERGVSLSLNEVAKELAVSSRTLQRRLRESGVVFADLATEVREQMARQLLRQKTVSVAEVAYLLGFSDQSSFTRAFKRWTGETPAAFRRGDRAPGGPRN